MMTYENAELEIIRFNAEDVLATSATTAATAETTEPGELPLDPWE